MRLTRRQLLALTGASLRAAPQRPNVLFLGVDDWRDWVGCLGQNSVKTPNLDRLAAEGLLFTNAHCPAPICNPSRTAIMTGLRPSTTGIYSNGQWWRPVLPDAVTLPAHFRQHGYYVAGGGKMFHHEPGFNDPQAWDDYYFWSAEMKTGGWGGGYNSAADARPPRFPMSDVNELRQNFDFAPLDQPDEAFPDYKVASWAAELLSKPHTKPFFLGVGMFRPHLSWYVPRKYFDIYPLENIRLPEVKDNDLEDVPPAALKMQQVVIPDEHKLVVKNGRWKEAVQAYMACITFSDAMVGRVLQALRAGPHNANTIVVLWSDHGYHLGEKSAWHKFTLWEESTRVPLIVRAPGITKAGSRCARPVSLIDLYPTLLDLCSLPARTGLDGQSIQPLLRNPTAPWQRPALTTMMFGNHSLRDERWRYTRYNDGSEELYDHSQDPKEWRNLATDPQYAAVKQRLSPWFPKHNQPDAPAKKSYRFDPLTHTWKKGRQ